MPIMRIIDMLGAVSGKVRRMIGRAVDLKRREGKMSEVEYVEGAVQAMTKWITEIQAQSLESE